MVVTKTPLITVYKQDKFSTAEVFLHFLKQMNKDFHMDNYHKADWSLCKVNYSKIPVTFSLSLRQIKGNMKIELIMKLILLRNLKIKVLTYF